MYYTQLKTLDSRQRGGLVKNPYDGKIYDLNPLFKYLDDENTSFEELVKDLVCAGDVIPQLLSPTHISHLRCMQNSLHVISGLRDTFAAIKQIYV